MTRSRMSFIGAIPFSDGADHELAARITFLDLYFQGFQVERDKTNGCRIFPALPGSRARNTTVILSRGRTAL